MESWLRSKREFIEDSGIHMAVEQLTTDYEKYLEDVQGESKVFVSNSITYGSCLGINLDNNFQLLKTVAENLNCLKEIANDVKREHAVLRIDVGGENLVRRIHALTRFEITENEIQITGFQKPSPHIIPTLRRPISIIRENVQEVVTTLTEQGEDRGHYF